MKKTKPLIVPIPQAFSPDLGKTPDFDELGARLRKVAREVYAENARAAENERQYVESAGIRSFDVEKSDLRLNPPILGGCGLQGVSTGPTPPPTTLAECMNLLGGDIDALEGPIVRLCDILAPLAAPYPPDNQSSQPTEAGVPPVVEAMRSYHRRLRVIRGRLIDLGDALRIS